MDFHNFLPPLTSPLTHLKTYEYAKGERNDCRINQPKDIQRQVAVQEHFAKLLGKNLGPSHFSVKFTTTGLPHKTFPRNLVEYSRTPKQ